MENLVGRVSGQVKFEHLYHHTLTNSDLRIQLYNNSCVVISDILRCSFLKSVFKSFLKLLEEVNNVKIIDIYNISEIFIGAEENNDEKLKLLCVYIKVLKELVDLPESDSILLKKNGDLVFIKYSNIVEELNLFLNSILYMLTRIKSRGEIF